MSIQNHPSATERSRILPAPHVGRGRDVRKPRPSNGVFGYPARSSHVELHPVNPMSPRSTQRRRTPAWPDLPVTVDTVDVFGRYGDPV